jgi:electron transport complex protein RnfC
MKEVQVSKTHKGTFSRGVHPPEEKYYSENKPIEILPTPDEIFVPLIQHIGAPCKVTVQPKQDVKIGDILGEAGGFVSAPIHSSINGKVVKSINRTLPNGRHIACVQIKADGPQLEGKALWEDVFGGEWQKSDLEKYAPEEIQKAVSAAGIVGMGGAGFPTHVKFARNPQKPIDTLIINGCECEPYLTADYHLMLEAPQPIVTGALLAAHAIGAKEIVIGIEDNKPEAIKVMKKACEGANINVMTLKTKYPQGGERSLLPAVTGRVIPTGGLPLDVGVVVVNVGTASAIARAVLRGKPLTHRVMTVTGGGVVNPKNLLVPVGVSYGFVLNYCGGMKKNASRAISGGPMMGMTIGDLNTPITKGASGFTILTEEEVKKSEETTCVRCGRCVDVCPLNLVPTKMAMASKHQAWHVAKMYHLMACVECGCCAFTCPASIPLVQLIRMGKAMLPKE